MEREEIITVRLTTSELKDWKEQAHSEGRPLSNWIRWKCNGDRDKLEDKLPQARNLRK